MPIRSAPGSPEPSSRPDTVLHAITARLDCVALGSSLGIWSGMIVFLATAFLLINGRSPVGPHLGLLSQYFTGYSVSWPGSVIGFGYGCLIGFLLGWLVAFLRNAFVTIYLHLIRIKTNLRSINDFIDEP